MGSLISAYKADATSVHTAAVIGMALQIPGGSMLLQLPTKVWEILLVLFLGYDNIWESFMVIDMIVFGCKKATTCVGGGVKVMVVIYLP